MQISETLGQGRRYINSQGRRYINMSVKPAIYNDIPEGLRWPF